MSTTSPMTTARAKLVDILSTEFAADNFQVLGDRLHKSLGIDGKTRIGVSPLDENPVSNNRLITPYRVFVQFYGAWKDVIDPTQIVDPTPLEDYAERFKQALIGNDPDTNSTWFFRLDRLTYPEDPTGNMTRFEADVSCFGENTSLLRETTG